MNGLRWTACFAKRMHNSMFSLTLRKDNHGRELSHKTWTDGRTDGQCSNLHFPPALNEPLRNNEPQSLVRLQKIRQGDQTQSSVLAFSKC